MAIRSIFFPHVLYEYLNRSIFREDTVIRPQPNQEFTLLIRAGRPADFLFFLQIYGALRQFLRCNKRLCFDSGNRIILHFHSFVINPSVQLLL